jgi:hypothetical protein
MVWIAAGWRRHDGLSSSRFGCDGRDAQGLKRVELAPGDPREQSQAKTGVPLI